MRNDYKYWLTGILIGLVVGAGLYCGFQTVKSNAVFHINRTNEEMGRYRKASTSDNKVLIFYQNGCRDCAQVEGTVSKLYQAHKDSTYLFEAHNQQVKPYLKQYAITQTPTFIVINKEKVVERYSGTDNARIKQLFEHRKERSIDEN